jgi:hypothetical protein
MLGEDGAAPADEAEPAGDLDLGLTKKKKKKKPKVCWFQGLGCGVWQHHLIAGAHGCRATGARQPCILCSAALRLLCSRV